MHTVAQKIVRFVLRMFFHALADGFQVHTFLKFICSDFVGGGLV
jgi:hypothetical protein